MVKSITTPDQLSAVEAYIEETSRKSDLDRTADTATKKTGAFTGAYAVNPLNGNLLPVSYTHLTLPTIA